MSGNPTVSPPQLSTGGRSTATTPSASPQIASYAKLKQLVKEKGLLEKQPGFLINKIILAAVMLLLSFGLLFVSDSLWLQLPNALFMAFVFVQLGFISHDVGHRQGFRTPAQNDVCGLIIGNLILGKSYRYWVTKHNLHHAHPNEVDMDPDIDIPILAFSEEQALGSKGIFRFLIKHQRYFFFPILTLAAPSLRFGSLLFLLRNPEAKYRTLEFSLITLHMILFFGLIILALGFWTALIFFIVQRALFGLYLGSVFAPNHKGMTIIDKQSQMNFLEQQVPTSRNVKASPLIDFWYGGLNYQIEHHLFPSMARNQLVEAQKIIRGYCDAHGISYHETSIWRSYKEILESLHEISGVLRVPAH